MNNKEVSLNEILMLLKKKWKFIVFIVSFFIMVGGGVSYLIPSTYEARTDLLVNYATDRESSKELQANEIETSLRLIETYSQILKSDRMVSKVIEKINEPYKKSDLKKNILIESNYNSQIISIIVQEKTPEKATLLANTYAMVFQEEIKALMNLENVNILNEISVGSDIREMKTHPFVFVLIFLLMGFIVASVAVTLQEFHFKKLSTVLKVERALSITNLGVVPAFERKSILKRKNKKVHGKLISNTESPMIVTEGFRWVRANVQFLMKQKNAKTILITSPDFGDGKSIVSGNLAIIMAMDGKKTVFVDANLRSPIGRELFDLPERKGLTSVISEHYQLEQVIQKTKTENLSFISSGPIPLNSTEVLSSCNMIFLMEKLKSEFDVIIIDAPPLVVADAVSLSTAVDGCLYIINAERTKEEMANKNLEQLRKVEATILGSILNRGYRSKEDIAY